MSEEIAPQGLALYRKYRPQTLDEVLGQPQITKLLQAAAKRDEFAHAYLLVGQRGTGKTSVARILAHLINQTSYNSEDFDIIEIDAASHGSVDDARELRDHANLAPLKARNKVYIIDEVHMLSRQAFDALLKLIEEPPAQLYFILATTEIRKVPATILSRIQQFTFHPVAPEIVSEHLREIADAEKINVDDEALLLIANRGEGSFRDSITLLDQLHIANQTITASEVETVLGLAPNTAIARLIDEMDDGSIPQLVNEFRDLLANGHSASELAKQLISELLKLAVERPVFYPLVEQLLDVTKSSNPSVKLLAILATFTQNSIAATKPKNVTKTVSALVENPPKFKQITHELTPDHDDHKEKISKKSKITAENTEANVPRDQKIIKPTATNKSTNTVTKSQNLVWANVLTEFEKLDEPASLAIAHAAKIQLTGQTLTLFFTKKFQRSRAGTRHFANLLSQAIENAGGGQLTIEVSHEPTPPDSSAAKVLDVMGGDIIQL